MTAVCPGEVPGQSIIPLVSSLNVYSSQPGCLSSHGQKSFACVLWRIRAATRRWVGWGNTTSSSSLQCPLWLAGGWVGSGQALFGEKQAGQRRRGRDDRECWTSHLLPVSIPLLGFPPWGMVPPVLQLCTSVRRDLLVSRCFLTLQLLFIWPSLIPPTHSLLLLAPPAQCKAPSSPGNSPPLRGGCHGPLVCPGPGSHRDAFKRKCNRSFLLWAECLCPSQIHIW